MRKFFYSSTMLYLLAGLLLLTFFLPDIIGPFPAIVIGVLVIAMALFVYNKWSQLPDPDLTNAGDQDDPHDSDPPETPPHSRC
jgi:hypothetical protein